MIDQNQENDVNNFRCKDCKHIHSCPRIDFAKINFAKPYFLSTAIGPCPCSAFEPCDIHVQAKRRWKGFWEWWPKFVEQWLPYGNTKILVYFIRHGDSSVRYGVPLMDYVNGNMFEGSRLKAVEKVYYKKTLGDGCGYKLIREKISGVEIDS